MKTPAARPADPAVVVQGHCEPRFARVFEAFESNFRELDELGAAVAVYLEGEPVVDLWGGHRDAEMSRPWERDTIVSMASTMKGMLAFALHMLADRGALDYDRPVADYWPEFAQAGKARITVRQAISHHAALHFTDAAEPGDMFRYERMVAAIARQRPEWPVGTRGVYHTISIIFILEKLIECAAGEPAWEFFRREVTEGLGIDFHIQMTDAELARYSPDLNRTPFFSGAASDPEVLARFFKPMGDPTKDFSPAELAKQPRLQAGGNARACGQLFAYAAMDGEIAGRRVLSPRTIDLMTEVQWHEPCAIWGTPMRTALGLLVSDPEFFYVGPNPKAFGTAGAGGSFAMADRENRLAVSYSLNRWWPALALGDRARRLIDAVYASVPIIP
jgi:CubicO group peptidase (beta-lactamase class C family)